MNTSKFTNDGYPRLFNRSEIKASFLQFGYGQQTKGTKAQLATDLGSKYDDSIYDVFIQAVNNIAPGFAETMHDINSLWQEDWDEVSWTMPDGFVVTCKPTSSDWVDFEIDERTITAKVTGVQRVKKALILYVNLIHSIDAFVMRQIVKNADYDIVTIHDATRCLANHSGATKQAYREALADINRSELLSDLLTQIHGSIVDTQAGSLDSDDILNSTYALC